MGSAGTEDPGLSSRTIRRLLAEMVNRFHRRLAGRLVLVGGQVSTGGDGCTVVLTCRAMARGSTGEVAAGSASVDAPLSPRILHLIFAAALADAIDRAGWGLAVFARPTETSSDRDRQIPRFSRIDKPSGSGWMPG